MADRLTGYRWLLLALLGCLVVAPSAEIGWFSGIPLDGAVEFVVALLVLPLMLSGEVRRRWASHASRLGARGMRIVLGVVIVALGAKVVLLVSDQGEGFRACYQSLVTVPGGASTRTPADQCELSYDNPLSRYGVTRLDQTIDFSTGRDEPPSSHLVSARPWNLDFFNSNRFNFYAWVEGTPDRRALPFAVTWEGEITEAASTTYVLRYLGEAAMTIGAGTTVTLPESYRGERVERIDVPAGTHALRIDYRFDRQLLRPSSSWSPYATMVVEHDDGTPVRSSPVRWPWRSLSFGVDAVTTALALSVVGALLAVLGSRVLVAPIAGAVAYAGIRLPGIGPHIVGIVGVGLLVFACSLLRRARASRGAVLLMTFWGVVAAELVRAHYSFGSFRDVVLRPGGDDYLTYESQAHAVLSGSLQGEEGVFVYSPAFRYVLALGHAVLGNGDARLSMVALVSLSMAVFAAAMAWWERAFGADADLSAARPHDVGLRAAFLVGVGATIMLTASPAVAFVVRAPLSEFPTWSLAPAALLLTTTPVTRRRLMLAAIVIGVGLTLRANHAPGLLVIVVIGLIAAWRAQQWSRETRRRTLLLALACLLAVSLLPAVHNVVYGGRLVFFADSATIPMNVPLPPADVIDLCCDAEVRDVFARQARMVAVIGTAAPVGFVVIIRYIQFAWLVSLGVLWLHRKRASATTFLVAALPAAFLVPHVFYQVGVYYPRHIVLGYLLMGLAAAHVFGAVVRPDAPGSRREEPEPPGSSTADAGLPPRLLAVRRR